MGKPTGFLELDRADRTYKPVDERVKHYKEFTVPLPEADIKKQASRCMDCGIPFCHTGCPVNNQIPDWNDLVYHGDWKEASDNLHSTNNFPEVTGRICPAPCEASCTLNIDDKPVTIKTIEYSIAERAWAEGWVLPQPPEKKTGKKVAIIAASRRERRRALLDGSERRPPRHSGGRSHENRVAEFAGKSAARVRRTAAHQGHLDRRELLVLRNRYVTPRQAQSRRGLCLCSNR